MKSAVLTTGLGGRGLGVLFAAMLVCICGAANAKEPAKISAEDYAEILRLYAEFNTTLDLRMPDRYVKTWTDDGEYQGGRTRARATPLEERKPDVVGEEALREHGCRTDEQSATLGHECRCDSCPWGGHGHRLPDPVECQHQPSNDGWNGGLSRHAGED